MKKIILVFGIVLLSMVVVLAEGNPIETFYLQIINKLDEIKTTIEGIEVSPVVNVEPNITVIPNVTIPEKECEWEKLNQKQILELSGFHTCCGYKSFTDTLHIPLDKLYSEATVINGRIVAECSTPEWPCRFGVNSIDCGTFSSPTPTIYEFPENCVNAIVGGKNDITLILPAYSSGTIHRVYLEMDVKPANC